jgi:hypothetical protein
VRGVSRRTGQLLLVAVLLAGPGGCGWLGASSAVTDADPRPNGSACAATVPGLVAGTPVKVSGPDGKLLATGSLGNGVIAHDGTRESCDLPFQIAAVPGGVDAYDIAVGTRAPKRFAAKDLRENADAVIPVSA